jgi:hypothetical protein
MSTSRFPVFEAPKTEAEGRPPPYPHYQPPNMAPFEMRAQSDMGNAIAVVRARRKRIWIYACSALAVVVVIVIGLGVWAGIRAAGGSNSNSPIVINNGDTNDIPEPPATTVTARSFEPTQTAALFAPIDPGTTSPVVPSTETIRQVRPSPPSTLQTVVIATTTNPIATVTYLDLPTTTYVDPTWTPTLSSVDDLIASLVLATELSTETVQPLTVWVSHTMEVFPGVTETWPSTLSSWTTIEKVQPTLLGLSVPG